MSGKDFVLLKMSSLYVNRAKELIGPLLLPHTLQQPFSHETGLTDFLSVFSYCILEWRVVFGKSMVLKGTYNDDNGGR